MKVILRVFPSKRKNNISKKQGDGDEEKKAEETKARPSATTGCSTSHVRRQVHGKQWKIGPSKTIVFFATGVPLP